MQIGGITGHLSQNDNHSIAAIWTRVRWTHPTGIQYQSPQGEQLPLHQIVTNRAAQWSSGHQSCHHVIHQNHASGEQQPGSDTLQGTETGASVDSNYFVLSIMYKSMHCLGSATHCYASYSLSATSQLWLHSVQYFLMVLCVNAMKWLERFIFPRLYSYTVQFSENRDKKLHILLTSEFMHYILSSNRSKFFSLPLSPVSISLDTQVLCCFVFSRCNGLPGTCGFCLCFALSSSFLSAAQCTNTLC